MSGYATIAESLDNPSAPYVYNEITDDPSAPDVYSEINPSQMYDDIVAVPSTSISSFAFDIEESSLSYQSKYR
jgi:hypothetical protein